MIPIYKVFRIAGWLAFISGLALSVFLIRPEPFASLFLVSLGSLALSPALRRLRDKDPLFVAASKAIKLGSEVFGAGAAVLVVSIPASLVICERWCLPYVVLLTIGLVLVIGGATIPSVWLALTKRRASGKDHGQST